MQRYAANLRQQVCKVIRITFVAEAFLCYISHERPRAWSLNINKRASGTKTSYIIWNDA